jgi:tetratricopeptide (TPR) repeat protein
MSNGQAMADEESWEETIAELIAGAEASADASDRVQRLQQAAQIYEQHLGDREKAYAVWQAAFNEDFGNERSALALERLASELGLGLSLAAETGALLRQVSPGLRRAALLVWTARWLLRFTGDRTGAEGHLIEAMQLDPASRDAREALRALRPDLVSSAPAAPAPEPDEAALVGPRVRYTDPNLGSLHERLDGLVEAQRWAEAVDVLKALAAGEGGEMRAKYLATAGKILHHKLGHDDAAVDLLNRALDAHANDLKSFERLYQILAGRRDWPGVEKNLRRMIQRFVDTETSPTTLEALWRRLGDVYRVGLKDLASAAHSYEMCARLAPHDPRYPQLLAQVTAQGPR